MTLTPPAVVMLLGLVGASWTDVRSWRIPNAITLTMVALGLVMSVTTADPWLGVLGLLAATVIHFPLWVLGVQRAGDAKLFMGVGALMGWQMLLESTLWAAVLYFPIGFAVLAATGRLSNLKAVAQWQLDKARGLDPGEPPETTQLRTGPIIAVACIAAWLTDLLDLL